MRGARNSYLIGALLSLSGCAASPERLRGEELAIDAIYRDFDCPALADEREKLDAEIVRTQAIVDSPAQWIPIVNIFTLPSQSRAIFDLEDARARLAGVLRAQSRQECPAIVTDQPAEEPKEHPRP